MTTGMIKPSWSFAEVFPLNALQKSMMFTPCWPSAGPTGGAGVAFPAGICSLTCPITFFAICDLYSVGPTGRSAVGTAAFGSLLEGPSAGPPTHKLHFLDLQKVQLHWSRAAEDRHHDFESIPVLV